MQKIFTNIPINNYLNFKKEELYTKLQHSGSVVNENKIITPKSIFFIKHYVLIKFKGDKIGLEIELRPMFNSIIIILIFTALFSNISFTIFLILEITFPIVYVLLNILWVKAYIKSNISDQKDIFIDNVLAENQQKWKKDPLKCTGCGENITKYTVICPNCGLSVKNDFEKNRFSTTNSNFNYTYIQKH